ncbi:MAG: hypothetical protein LBU24_00705, partial [Methanocalculaceae archaeon]|nr:hypothetical protein [Methanocalculaceae archaeon]
MRIWTAIGSILIAILLITSQAQPVLAQSLENNTQQDKTPKFNVSEKTLKFKYTYEPNKFNTTILKYIHEPERTVILEYQKDMQKYTAKPNKYTTNIDRYVKGNWEQKGNI